MMVPCGTIALLLAHSAQKPLLSHAVKLLKQEELSCWSAVAPLKQAKKLYLPPFGDVISGEIMAM